MTLDEILNAKILISEFMGRKFNAYKDNHSFTKNFDTYKECEEWISKLGYEGYAPQIEWMNPMGKYHSSWDSIMEVCKKWDTEIHTELKDTEYHSDYIGLCDLLDNAVTKYEIEPVFEQITENIKWYNNLKNDTKFKN